MKQINREKESGYWPLIQGSIHCTTLFLKGLLMKNGDLKTQGNLNNMIQVQILGQTVILPPMQPVCFSLWQVLFPQELKVITCKEYNTSSWNPGTGKITGPLKEFNPRAIKSGIEIALAAFSLSLEMGVFVLVDQSRSARLGERVQVGKEMVQLDDLKLKRRWALHT